MLSTQFLVGVASVTLLGLGPGSGHSVALGAAVVVITGTDGGLNVDAVREDAGHASSMLVDSPLPAQWASELDAIVSGDVEDPAGRLAEIEAEVDAVLSAIVAPEPFTFTLTGTSNTLRLPIRNTGEEPLRVDVRVRSPKLTTDKPTQQVEVPALSSFEVDVPVEARSRGTFTIEVDVLAPGRLPHSAARRAQGTGQPCQRARPGGHRRRRARPGLVVVHPLAPTPR